MERHIATTPFGRRSLTLAHVAAQMAARERAPDLAVNKWKVFDTVRVARHRIGVSDRALSVLNALLSFFPEAELAGDALVVFPSNRELILRANGMAPATLRRHLAQLVDCGLVIRRDSPNGKRYARKAAGGAIAEAFGFDLAPLVVRAGEFAEWAAEVRAHELALRRQRERVTLLRRDILKMIATGEAEGVEPARFATVPGRAGEGTTIERFASWDDVRERYVEIAGRLHRKVTDRELAEIEAAFAALGQAVSNILESHIKFQNISANESQSERHKQNSNPNRSLDSEPRFQESRGEAGHNPQPAGEGRGEPVEANTDAMPETRDEAGNGDGHEPDRAADRAGGAEAPPEARPDGVKPARAASDGAFPLGMVMQACPDLAAYAPDGVRNWRDFLDTAAKVRPMLGISPSAWEEAEAVMGEVRAAITVAAILQRAETISSPGGYLRSLTAKAETGAFSLGPMLMALLAANRPNLRRSA